MTPIDHEELTRLIRGIGMKPFVFILYPELKKDSTISVAELIRKYPEYSRYTHGVQNTKLSKSKKIFVKGWQREALHTIASSQMTELETRQEARRLLSL